MIGEKWNNQYNRTSKINFRFVLFCFGFVFVLFQTSKQFVNKDGPSMLKTFKCSGEE